MLYYCWLNAGIGGRDSLKDIILITCFIMHVSVEESVRCVLKTQTYSLSILFFFISSLYQTGDVDKSTESSMTTIKHFAKMENGFDLCGT